MTFIVAFISRFCSSSQTSVTVTVTPASPLGLAPASLPLATACDNKDWHSHHLHYCHEISNFHYCGIIWHQKHHIDIWSAASFPRTSFTRYHFLLAIHSEHCVGKKHPEDNIFPPTHVTWCISTSGITLLAPCANIFPEYHYAGPLYGGECCDVKSGFVRDIMDTPSSETTFADEQVHQKQSRG